MSKLANIGVETALSPITKHQEIAADVNEIGSFADYLAERLPTLSIHLKIRKSRFCGGVDKNLYGIADATADYDWKSSWNSDDRVVESQDWTTTKASIGKLRLRLKKAVESLDEPNDKNIIAATRSILEWGGNRRWDKGAYEFLLWLDEQSSLRRYLRDCKGALSLQSNDPSNPNAVLRMNSMLTKVHALLADDGLPIYDSRVAVAIAIMAEKISPRGGA
jgi:hypothetical protein